MIGEISLYGIYLPTLMLLSLLAIVCSRLLSYVFTRCGVYRYVWHPALFDFAVFILLLGAFTFFLPHEIV